jgi:long-chain acyl-CoA synthetase
MTERTTPAPQSDIELAHESLELYHALTLKAFDVCTAIAQYAEPDDPSALRIWEVARDVIRNGATSLPAAGGCPTNGAAFEALDKLLEDWPQLHSGETTGELAYAQSGDLWERLMYEPPMGTYAHLAAAFLNGCVRSGHKVIELGAGVGNTSRLLKLPEQVVYVRSDKNALVLKQRNLPGTSVRYDFDHPSSISDADIVFAVNALHCAENPRRTLSYLKRMLCTGGTLILAEGEPRPEGDRRWALDVLFCQFQGWWDRGGFRSRSTWIEDLRAEGYGDVGYQRLVAGASDLGGLVWARC